MTEMRMDAMSVPRLPGDGVWMAGYKDGSASRPFPSELEALRHANGSNGSGKVVEFVPWGMSFAEVRNERWDRRREDAPDA